MTAWPFAEPPQTVTYAQTAPTVTDLDPPAGPVCWAAPGTLDVERVHACGLPHRHAGGHRCLVPACGRSWP